MIDAERVAQDVEEQTGRIKRLLQRCTEQRADINETMKELEKLKEDIDEEAPIPSEQSSA